MSDTGANPTDPGTPLERRLELAITIGLGLAAVVTALFVYLVDVHDDNADLEFSDGIAQTTEATGSYVSDAQQRAADNALFTEFAKEANAATYGDRIANRNAQYIQTAIMGPELQAAVAWWSQENERRARFGKVPLATPFVAENPDYSAPHLAAAEQQSAEAQVSFEEARDEQQAGDTFIIADVIVATSLFLFGLAGVTKREGLKLRMTVIAYAVFVLSLGVAILG